MYLSHIHNHTPVTQICTLEKVFGFKNGVLFVIFYNKIKPICYKKTRLRVIMKICRR